MNTNVVVKLQVEGIHKWELCDIEDVSFLQNSHRHIFWITVKKTVFHADREVEIICLKRQITGYLEQVYGKVCDFGSKSCEMIAQELVDKFSLCYCEVLEDNENGAEVTV